MRRRQGSHNLAPYPFLPLQVRNEMQGRARLGPYGCRVALQTNSCCTMPVSAALGRACGVECPLTRDTWLGHPSRSGPWLPGSQCPGTATQGGGAFALRAPLSTTGELGGENGAFTTRQKVSAAVPGGQLRHTESCKPNETKQKNGSPPLHGHWPASDSIF